MQLPPEPPPPPPSFESFPPQDDEGSRGEDPPYEPSRAPQVLAWVLVGAAILLFVLVGYLMRRCSQGMHRILEEVSHLATERDPYARVRKMEPITVDEFLGKEPLRGASDLPQAYVVRGEIRSVNRSEPGRIVLHLAGTRADLRCAFDEKLRAYLEGMAPGGTVTVGGTLHRDEEGLPELTACSTPAVWRSWDERIERRRRERHRRPAEDPNQPR